MAGDSGRAHTQHTHSTHTEVHTCEHIRPGPESEDPKSEESERGQSEGAYTHIHVWTHTPGPT